MFENIWLQLFKLGIAITLQKLLFSFPHIQIINKKLGRSF